MEEKIKKIKERIDEISSELESIYFDPNYLFLELEKQGKSNKKIKEKLEEMYKELNELNKNLTYLAHMDFAIKNKPDISNDTLDLYLENYEKGSNAGTYAIYKHDTYEYIGEISYKGPLSSVYGNVSYMIETKHRGNNYATLALKLMGEDLYNKGVKELYISAQKENIASIKTIEKFGGKLIDDSKGIVKYKCDLNLIIKNKKICR